MAGDPPHHKIASTDCLLELKVEDGPQLYQRFVTASLSKHSKTRNRVRHFDVLRYTFQLFWSAVVYSFGDVFRLPWYTNLVSRPKLNLARNCEESLVPTASYKPFLDPLICSGGWTTGYLSVKVTIG